MITKNAEQSVQDIEVTQKQPSQKQLTPKEELFTAHCGNLPLNIKLQECKDFFKDFKVTNVVLRKTSNGQYCYAFVNFESQHELERALVELNYCELQGHEVIMCEYNPEGARNYGDEGNIFVSNLPSDLSTKELYRMFNSHGSVATCKVARNKDGTSKGYGFVKFKSPEDAEMIVQHSQLFKVANRKGTDAEAGDEKAKLKIEHYDPGKQRRNSVKEDHFTNVYVRNFPPTYTKEDLHLLMKGAGEITNIYFPVKEETGRPVGYANVNYKNHEDAKKAIESFHGAELFSNYDMEKPEDFIVEPFYVQKSEKRRERIENYSAESQPTAISTSGVSNVKKNLYIRNVPNSFSKDEIFSVLREFGEIIDFDLKEDSFGENKMYGFVCYATSEEAAIALEKSKQVLLDSSQLELSVYKSKQQRSLDYTVRRAAFAKRNSMSDSPVPGAETAGEFKEKLFDRVLPIAKHYEREFNEFGVKTEDEFAEKVAEKLAVGFPESKRDKVLSDKGELSLFIRAVLRGSFDFSK